MARFEVSCSRSSPARAGRGAYPTRRSACGVISPVFTARAWCERRAPRWAPTSSRTSCSWHPPRRRPGSARPSPRSLWRVVCRPALRPRCCTRLGSSRVSARGPRSISPRSPSSPRATHHRPARSDSTHRRRNPRDRIETHPRRVSARPSRPRARAGRARRGDARHERPPRSNLATRRRGLRRRVLPRRAHARARVRPGTRRLP